MTEPTLYKVLKNGNESFNGGNLKWSLPRKRGKGYQPGKWHEAEGEIRVCSNGLHLTIEPYRWWQWDCTVYEAQGEGVSDADGDKVAFQRARLLRPVVEPAWLLKTKELIAEIQVIKWLENDGSPRPEWKVYPTRDAAWDAAWDAARDAAWDAARAAAWDAAWDAARAARLRIYVQGICSDLKIDETHRIHADARWEVWRKGYGLLCDVDGVLYVYEKVS